MNLVLIRHTRVAAPAGVCFGRTDVPLAPTFAEEAAAVRARLPWTPRAVWSSPARRCRALAESLAPGAVCVDPRLQALDFGAWEGRRWDEFRDAESEAWALDPWARRPPGGETAAELWARVGAVRAELLARAEQRLAIVTHAGVIRAWRSHATGRPWADVFAEPVECGEIEPAM
ncbi:MAG TPA: histidine phosphatase family protein [Opitutaceae bacterium]